MKKLALDKMGLMPLEVADMREITGGAIPRFFKSFFKLFTVELIIEHWDEIKSGLKKGWNFDK